MRLCTEVYKYAAHCFSTHATHVLQWKIEASGLWLPPCPHLMQTKAYAKTAWMLPLAFPFLLKLFSSLKILWILILRTMKDIFIVFSWNKEQAKCSVRGYSNLTRLFLWVVYPHCFRCLVAGCHLLREGKYLPVHSCYSMELAKYPNTS